ncbi:MAG: hypothetical protein KKE02_13835 [Alphaproteobacteria bacterium]|nr:hypothetical protein [Alphaproteobacteria bacterium]MBU1513057.1 hypothetical protein [Alphaproteobacteria bacterium]MBU2095165.1 hypothetical protein [Alphaproteobacteria bacterium]MBU2152094.1 hypothetical protein [Alphaproteobacteria bacterium]MBU2306416.1 hypothetical protein [Alphaproteobacteria bacterium]
MLRWHYRQNWGMTIGQGVRISRKANIDKTNPKGVKIGDYTAVAFNATILTHDFVNGRDADVTIGANCLIGANSTIMPGVTIGDSCIVGPGSLVLTDVPDNCAVLGNPARVVERGIVTGKWGIRNPKFLAQEGIVVPGKASLSTSKAPPVNAAPGDLLASYLPSVTDPAVPFADQGIDSFTIVTLRAEIEENEGSYISDEDWTSIERPSDLLRFITRPKALRTGEVVGATAQRAYEINMPQMALGGLSESWLFKEMGDLHWSLLTSALGVKSRDIADQGGERLYATFTRIRYTASEPLGDFRENDELLATAAMTRFGAGMFFSSVKLTSDVRSGEFEIMSSFAKFGESGENTSLTKGQPAIPDGFAVPSLPEMPEFAVKYRERRATEPPPAIFETEYEILAQHDINGVGLLYFAAYPTISDICLNRYLGPGSALEWSPISRDVCYFANSGAADKLIYRVHVDETTGANRRCVGTISRASDGKRMALVEVNLRKR